MRVRVEDQVRVRVEGVTGEGEGGGEDQVRLRVEGVTGEGEGGGRMR